MSLSQQLKDQTAAVMFQSHKFGVRKKVDAPTRAQAARPFSADPTAIAVSKNLLDTRSQAFADVTAVIIRARRYWKSMTVFFPVRGTRLIHRDRMTDFDIEMKRFRDELESAVQDLLGQYKELKKDARQKLGQLYSPSDYPTPDTLVDEFKIEWSYPAVDPPNYLKQPNPRLYEQEQARVAARFEEAMAAAQQTLAAELQQLLAHLVDRLTPNESGRRRSLSPKAIEGLKDFVERFQQLGIHTSGELDSMVRSIQEIAQGVDVASLRQHPEQQAQLFTDVTAAKQAIDELLVDAPDRKITLDDDDEP